MTKDRLFIGVFPTGISYCDRSIEIANDFKVCAYLPFDTLQLKVYQMCTPELLPRIRMHAESIQAREGEEYPIDVCGHTVILGGSNAS